MKECGVKLRLFWPLRKKHLQPAKRVKLLIGDEKNEGLLTKAKRAGVEQFLIDPGVLDVASSSWTAMAIRDIKEQHGLPVAVLHLTPFIYGKKCVLKAALIS